MAEVTYEHHRCLDQHVEARTVDGLEAPQDAGHRGLCDDHVDEVHL